METFFLIIGAVLLSAAVVTAFLPSRWSAPIAWAGLLVLLLSGHIVLSTGQLVFWAIAAAIVVGIDTLLPREVARSRRGVAYIAGGAFVGTFVGMAVSGPALILGSIAGAFFGSLAYCRTPHGRAISFPSAKYLNYLAAKGLPAVVTLCIVGIAVGLIISQYSLLTNIN